MASLSILGSVLLLFLCDEESSTNPARFYLGAFTVVFAVWLTSVLRRKEQINRNYVPMAAIILMLD